MTTAFGRLGAALILAFSAILVLAGALSSEGLYLIDELIYAIGVEAFRTSQSFEVQNGFKAFGSEDLRIWLLAKGPNGFTPQYPPGTAIAGAGLTWLFGSKALIALNVCAGVGTLWVTHAVARRLFQSADIANLSVILLTICTFWAEYVFAHWPHAVTVFLVNLAFLLFLNVIDRKEYVFGSAFLSGIAIGVCMFFRLDGLLLLPVITIVTILYARIPIVTLSAGAAGFLPVAALLALINKTKFDTWNPLSYGTSSGGSSDVTAYLPLLSVGIIIAGCLVLLRLYRGTRKIDPRIVVGVLGLGVLLSSVSVPAMNKLVTGINAILIDATTISDWREGVRPQANGTLIFWGVPKKALAQSLPWLGCLALLLGMKWGGRQRSVSIILIFFVVWALPFIMRNWHGGLSPNMRYLLPTLPVLGILAAWIIQTLEQKCFFRKPRLMLGLSAFLTACILLLLFPGQIALLHQIATVYLFVIIAVLLALAGFFLNSVTAAVSLFVMGIGLGASSFLAIDDIQATQNRREVTAQRSNDADMITGPVVIYGSPESFASAFSDPQKLVALPHVVTGKIDTEFVYAACQAGYRVLVASWMVENISQSNSDLRLLEMRTPAPDTLSHQIDCLQ
ncbi:YfhO family protein [Cognatishimia maritima]|uniref:Membrane protein YfhO n=1 Tax=Cognatishimia maritima TaxID=870908 RepID=A0A1M5WCV1_9RHOB|nr:YfhO family protein [Cognatishimia maritima]SHH85399.1 membrane protein YfhO [Cognatishimia maritima]